MAQISKDISKINEISYKIIGCAFKVKSVEALAPIHGAQVLTYLKPAKVKLGSLQAISKILPCHLEPARMDTVRTGEDRKVYYNCENRCFDSAQHDIFVSDLFLRWLVINFNTLDVKSGTKRLIL